MKTNKNNKIKNKKLVIYKIKKKRMKPNWREE